MVLRVPRAGQQRWGLAALLLRLRAAGTDDAPPITWAPLSWKWHSQYGQDRYIFERFFASDVAIAAGGGPYRRGTFVELGAADGLDKSNTLAFEQNLGWTGILIEPASDLFAQLQVNRPNSICLYECVARQAGQYEFKDDGLNSGFSMHRTGTESTLFGAQGVTRFCRTLPDILQEHLGTPAHIDYMSLDLEGGEMDILESLDFTRITIDVLSIEVHEHKEHERARRMAELLERRGFHFVERLVFDEIWVRRRGLFSPDPTCMLPSLEHHVQDAELVGPPKGWASLRRALRWLSGFLAERLSSGTGGTLEIPWEHQASMVDLVELWDQDRVDTIEALCPVAILAAGVAISVAHNRKTYKVLDGSGVASELRHQTIFHPTAVLGPMVRGYNYKDEVTASEREAVSFQVRFPLGRSWHETSFLDIIESGWPLFGLLDVAARATTFGGHYFERVPLYGEEFHFPLRVPRPTCALEVLEASAAFEGTARMAIVSENRLRGGRRAPRTAVVDLVLDADACALIGVAAARFHAARAEVLRAAGIVPRDTGGSRSAARSFVPLANWSVAAPAGACAPGRPLGPDAAARCLAMPPEECAALDAHSRPLPRRCLHLRRAARESLRLRRSPPLAGTRAGQLIKEGERLFREFVRKHGLFLGAWAAASPEFAPVPPGVEARPRSWDGDPGAGETLFAVLHAIQEAVLAREGLAL